MNNHLCEKEVQPQSCNTGKESMYQLFICVIKTKQTQKKKKKKKINYGLFSQYLFQKPKLKNKYGSLFQFWA